MNINNISKKYWEVFYKKKKITSKPTKFSKFCYKYLKDYRGILYDAGCGNGRDTLFFNKKKINTIGLDLSKNIIENNKKKFRIYSKNFKKKNFCSFFKKKILNKFSVYSRFSLHTINKENEIKFINFLSKQKKLDYLFIETRTIKDELYGRGKKVGKNEYITNHYRRFIEPLILKKKLLKKFKIIYFNQSRDFAVYKNYRPTVLRIILKKK